VILPQYFEHSVKLGEERFRINVGAGYNTEFNMSIAPISYGYRFTGRWTAGAMGQAFYLKVSDSTFNFSGSVLSLGLKTEYWLFNNVGIGAALNYFNLNADVEDDDWKGELDYQYFGPQIYLTVRF
jgi:hypothetical protein